ncbi:Leucine-rich repeat-containing protein 15 [Echinococcus granulosus]|uniref:Leucine rich repeat typical subtype n=1 Tax=Echinococcus granulosus TaxID=6210 RepID=U6JFJ6_ECHGR|nr:Leucine-rich repeat-containing protein [Echinococcus granulosus]EUB59534.1 Leucine-rich repeat-containing protein [Echinococcus granulosus]KAH9277983.1 Leucine-rich repeat-containing protein 15 [Echinococcus granulosus]CDS20519.1 Leucine rich repeat typical subtype [Echinococcus granulosus]
MKFHFGLLLLQFIVSKAGTVNVEGVRCEETPAGGNSSKLTAECWIHPEAKIIPCITTWDTLHLEIMGDQDKKETVLQPSLFSHCGHLRVLAIWDGGPLSRLQRDVFQPLYNLERLVVRSKKLQFIDRNFLLFLPHLQLLSITDSKALERLGQNILEPLPRPLTTLDLSNNQLMDLHQLGAFGNHVLHNLYLQNNKISRLYRDSLFELSELRLLRLSGNQLSGSLETALGIKSPGGESPLISVPKLEILDLANNYLTEISGCQWAGGCGEHSVLTKLRVLNLAKNRLTWIDPTAFQGLSALTELRLEGNNNLFQAGSLPVVLFSLTQLTHPDLKHLAIPQEVPGNGAIEMCANDPLVGSRIVLRAMEHLSKNFCEKTSPLPLSLETTAAPTMNFTPMIPDLPANEGPVFTFIRRTHRWVLTSIAIGLLLTGVLISALIFVCLHFGLHSDPPKEQEIAKEPVKPAIVYAPSRMSLQHIYTQEGCYPAYLPLARPPPGGKRLSRLKINGTPLIRNQELARRRNASNSVYSLLSAPPNATAALVASSINLINAQPTTKHAIV